MDKAHRDLIIKEIIQIVKDSKSNVLLKELSKELLKFDQSQKVKVRYFGKLPDTDKHKIEGFIQNKFPDAGEITYEEDQNLMGGFEIIYKDMKIDNSLKSRFHVVKNIINDK